MKAGLSSRSRHGGGGIRAAGGLALAGLVSLSLTSGAAIAGATPIGYPDFSSVAGLTLNGDAAQVGSVLRLAPNDPFQDGSAWAQTQIDTTWSFESRFEGEVHSAPFTPANGMTFTIQSEGPGALGGDGSDHGYAGAPPVAPSVAIDVSPFPQIMLGGNEQFSIVANGDLATPLATATSAARLFGRPFWVWVDYDATAKNLEVFLGQTDGKPAAPLLSTAVDLGAAVGPSAYMGFTASTGALTADFDLMSWAVDVTGAGDTTPPAVTCSASPSVLWPPNGKLRPVTTAVAVTDAESGPAGFTLLSVTSNEGDINKQSSDWTPGTPDTGGYLRAARFGSGNGRTYTLTYEGADNAGNTATCSTSVTVPHDQG